MQEQRYDEAQINIQALMEKLQCCQKKRAISFCAEKQCKKPAIVCADKQCSCRKEIHQNCLIEINIDRLSCKLLEKKINDLERNIRERTRQIYNQLIEMLSTQCENMAFKMANFGLQNHQIQLLKKIQGQKENQITGLFMSQVLPQLSKKLDYQLQAPDEKQVLEIIQESKKKILNFTKQLNPLIEMLPRKMKICSKILTNKDQQNFVFSLFQKKIAQFKLLYRASQELFLASAFDTKCHNIPNTMILAKTQKDKLIGAFTQKTWEKASQWKQDEKLANFLFSITMRQKFSCSNATYGMYTNANTGPYFGASPDFYICNQANKNTSAFAIGHSYRNQRVNTQNQQYYTEFCGATSGYATTMKQWQVFQLIFE